MQSHYKYEIANWMMELQDRGAGEILLTSVDLEGTWKGLDLKLINELTDKVSIPVIANGGVGKKEHISKVFSETSVSAVAVGSMVVFQKEGMGVLVNTKHLPR